MLHRSIKFIYAAVLAFSALVAFLFIRGLDEQYVLGHSAVVWVTDSNDSTTAASVVAHIESFASKNQVSVARDVPDLRNPDGIRHLYMATGAPESLAGSWLKQGYPSFGRDYLTQVHELADIAQRDPRGFYYVFGTHDTADALARELSALGLDASVHRPLSFEQLTTMYSDDVLVWAVAVVALAAMTMTGAGVLLNAKSYGVLRLQGMSFTAILLRDLRQLTMFGAIATSVTGTGALVFLGLYNRCAWLGVFGAVTLSVAGFLVLLILATHAAMLAMTFKTGVLQAIKGELPARAATTCAYLIRLPAILLAFSIAGSTVMAGQDVLSREDSRRLYAEVGDTSAIRLNGSVNGDAIKKMEKRVGAWLRHADAQGELIVAGRRELRDLAPQSQVPQGEMLIVNETFLAHQTIRDTAGNRYAAAPRKGKGSDDVPVRLIVPTSLSRYAPELAAEIPGTLSPEAPERIRPEKVQTLESGTGQEVFGYNPGDQVHTAALNTREDRSLVRDPVLLVIPNGSSYLTDNAYSSFATQGGVVFPDPADIQAGIEANKLQSEVIAIRPIGHNAALQRRDAINDFRMNLFNLGIAIAVLVITGIGVCIVYTRKNAQAIFVRHISGWRFVSSHRTVLGVEALLVLVLAAWLPYSVWRENQELRDFAAMGIPAPNQQAEITATDLGLTAGLVAVSAGAVLLALAAFHRRIVKEGAAEG